MGSNGFLEDPTWICSLELLRPYFNFSASNSTIWCIANFTSSLRHVVATAHVLLFLMMPIPVSIMCLWSAQRSSCSNINLD